MIQLNEPSPPYWQTTPHTAEKHTQRERERDENEDIRSPSNETSKEKRLEGLLRQFLVESSKWTGVCSYTLVITFAAKH